MDGKSKVAYGFGDYLLEVSERRLWKEKELIPLTPKAFETLVVLVSNKGRVVEKDTLLDKVWADTFVEEGTLAQNILTLRKALGHFENGRQFIETVPRVGYRFINDVKEIVSDDEIVILEHHIKTQITAEHQSISSSDLEKHARTKTLVSKGIEYFRRHKILAAVQLAVVMAVFIGIAGALRFFWQPQNSFTERFNKIEVSRLTSEGNIIRSAISPDGKYLAFVKADGDEQSIFTKQINGNSPIEILPSRNQRIIGLTFSPDGNFIYFVSYENTNSTAPTKDISFGSNARRVPQEILADIDSPAAISPDGKQIAHGFSEQKLSSLISSDIDGKNEKNC